MNKKGLIKKQMGGRYTRLNQPECWLDELHLMLQDSLNRAQLRFDPENLSVSHEFFLIKKISEDCDATMFVKSYCSEV